MSESAPQDDVDYILRITDEATHGLSVFSQHGDDYDQRQMILEDIDNNDKKLIDMLSFLANQWKLDKRETRNFITGFLVGRTLLDYQVSINETSLPAIRYISPESFLVPRSPLVDQTDPEDIDANYGWQMQGELEDGNGKFVESIWEYASQDASRTYEDMMMVVLGGACLYDLIYQQAKLDSLVSSHIDRSFEGPVHVY